MSDGAGKGLVVGCVADNNRKYLDQALRLLQSWRWFAGDLAEADFRVCVVDNVPDADRALYESYGATVEVVPRVSTLHPPSNKLRFLETDAARRADRVLLLDCDTVVMQAPTKLLAGLESADFVAKIVDGRNIGHLAFRRLFAAFDVEHPAEDQRCTVTGQATVPYFNSGVIALSRQGMAVLVPEWISVNDALIPEMQILGKSQFFCEQASLCVAVARTKIPFFCVGNEMNFPAQKTGFPPESDLARTDPVIIHYHSRVDTQGYLQSSPYPKVEAKVARFNARLKQERRDYFNNRQFWNARYTADPALGSGVGSRGQVLTYKRCLLEATAARLKPSTVLDVGCGDMSIGEVLPDAGYVGVDVSDVAIEMNAKAYPRRRFVHGDPLVLDLEPADLVVCLDVLIHQPTAQHYRRLVERLVSCAAGGGVISGYDAAPASGSDITFFYEPLKVTLESAGAANVTKIGGYRQVSVYRFEKGYPKSPAAPTVPADLTRPIFLVGTMRSGTTVLADLLDGSRDIAYCRFELREVWSRVGGVQMASAKTRDTECRELSSKDANPEIAARLRPIFLNRARARQGKDPDARFLNKNPHLSNKLAFVTALFPDSQVISVHRDLPQVAASLKRLFSKVNAEKGAFHWWPEPSAGTQDRCWSAFHGEEARPATLPSERIFPGGRARYLAEYWFETNRAIAGFAAQGGRVLRIRQEELVEDPGRELARCFAHLELPLSIPPKAVAKLDPARNAEWLTVLDAAERSELAGFVRERSDEIDLVFGAPGLAERYLSLLATG